MTGEELHKRVKAAGLSVEEMKAALGLSKQGLYDLYKKNDIGDFYLSKAKDLGLTEVKLSQDTIPFTAPQLFKMWEDAERQRQAVTDALVALVDTHKKMLEKKFNLSSN